MSDPTAPGNRSVTARAATLPATPESVAPVRNPTRWQWLALTLALGLLVLLGFGHTRHDFFVGDDFVVTYASSRITQVSEALDVKGEFRQKLIREVYPDFTLPVTLIRPLPSLSFWFDYLRSQTDPAGYHSTALGLHILAALLVALLAQVLTGRFAAAAIAGAFFALHPAHPEAVVWIAARSDLLVTPTMLLSLLAWLRFVDARGWRWLALACLGFAAALASKEMAVALPGVALALTVASRAPGRWGRASIGTLALAVVLLAYVGFRVAYVGLHGYAEAPGGAWGAAANAARFLRDAAWASVWPGDRIAHGNPDGLRLAFLTTTVLLSALGIRAAPRLLPALGACALAFVLSTAPVATWAGLNATGEGSRLIYPSLVFVAIALGASASAALVRHRLGAGLALAGLLLAALFGLWRALEPWQRAAATSQALVLGLQRAAAGKQAFVLVDDLPAKDGPAYLAQNAFPPAIWLFVSRGARVEWLNRTAWEAAAVEHRETLAREPTLAVLRWDAALHAWVGPDGRPAGGR